MSDERHAHNPSALDEATDRIIREMTQVDVSEDAVTRVMARVRAARGAEAHAEPRGWFAGLLEPRISWGAAAAAAALAAIIATSGTAFVLRPQATGTSALAAGAPSHAGSLPVSSGIQSSPQAAAASNIASAGHTATDAPAGPRAQADIPLGVSTSAASSGASAEHGASDAAAAASRVAKVERPKRSGVGKAAGVDSTVTAAMVATPDEEPAKAQNAAPVIPRDVRVEVTIHDQSGAGKPVSKTVAMVVADHEAGSIRSQTRMPFKVTRATPPNGPAPVEAWNTEDLPLSVDAQPSILPDGHVRVKLGISYRTASAPSGAGEPMATATVTKNVIAVLTDGKPLIVSESADAATDRKVSVEVRATIQK